MPGQIAIHAYDVIAGAGVNQVEWHVWKKLKTVLSSKAYSAFITGLVREGSNTAAMAVTTHTMAT